jgi:hypothetical protein
VASPLASPPWFLHPYDPPASPLHCPLGRSPLSPLLAAAFISHPLEDEGGLLSFRFRKPPSCSFILPTNSLLRRPCRRYSSFYQWISLHHSHSNSMVPSRTPTFYERLQTSTTSLSRILVDVALLPYFLQSNALRLRPTWDFPRSYFRAFARRLPTSLFESNCHTKLRLSSGRSTSTFRSGRSTSTFRSGPRFHVI